MNYNKWLKKTDKLTAKLPKPPYHGHIELTPDCSLVFDNDTVFAPEEAVRVAKWILEFYGDIKTNV